MSGPQTIYDDYLKEYGYIPKQSSYLIAYAKKSGAKLKYSEARQIITKNATNTSTEKKASNKPKKIKSNKLKTSNKKKTPRKTAKKINSSKPAASKNKNVSNRPKSKKKTPSPNKTNGVSAPPKKTQSEDSKTQSNKPKKSKTKSNSPKAANKKKHTEQTPKPRTPKSAKKINSSKPPPPPTVNKNVLNQPKPPKKQKKPPPPNKINSVPAPPKKTQSENAKTPNHPKLPDSVNKKPNPPQSPKRPKKTPPPNKRNSLPAPPKKTQSEDSKTADPKLSNSVWAPPKRVFFKSISVTTSEPPLFRQNALAQSKSKSVPTDHRKSLSTSAVKLPHPPPRSQRCNKPSTATKFIPSTDEKESAQFIPSGAGNAKPFMCRVNYECKTQKGKQEIYDALKLLAPNPGTITYHFTAPNAVKYPLKLEFIELYYDENAYFKQLYYYTKAPQFEKAYFKHVKSKTVLTIGEHLSDKIRKIIGIKFKSRFGQSEAGYLFHENYLKSLDYTDATKLMFKFHVIVPGKEENVALYFSIMDRLGVYAKESYALMFNCHRLDVEVYPNYLELISIWPNIECLLEFLQKDKVQIIMMEFKQLMIKQTDKVNRKNHVLCELYAENEIKCEVMQMIHMVFDDIGYTQQLKTDAGYILHPKANSAQLK